MDDKMTGRGYMVWADGRRYDGEWLENRCNGRGVLTYKDGRRYEGEYKLDKMHGKGVPVFSTQFVDCECSFTPFLNPIFSNPFAPVTGMALSRSVYLGGGCSIRRRIQGA